MIVFSSLIDNDFHIINRYPFPFFIYIFCYFKLFIGLSFIITGSDQFSINNYYNFFLIIIIIIDVGHSISSEHSLFR